MEVNDKKLEKSIRARWGLKLSESRLGFTPIVNILLVFYSLLGINESEFMFILQAINYKWDIRKPYPSLNTIAAKMDKKRSTVQALARGLERKGYIKRIQKTGFPNELDFNPLIKVLEYLLPYEKSDREFVKKMIQLYPKTDTKEDPSRRFNKESSFTTIGDLVGEKYKADMEGQNV